MSKEFEKSSQLRKSNRASTSSAPHSSGSIPYAIQRKRQEKELGRRLTQYETFTLTHLSKQKNSQEKIWVSQGAKRTADDYETKLRDKHGDFESSVHDLADPGLEVWKETTGGVKAGKLIGRPREGWSSRVSSSRSLQFASQESSAEMQSMREYMLTQYVNAAVDNSATGLESHFEEDECAGEYDLT